jgi:hypothetical protein
MPASDPAPDSAGWCAKCCPWAADQPLLSMPTFFDSNNPVRVAQHVRSSATFTRWLVLGCSDEVHSNVTVTIVAQHHSSSTVTCSSDHIRVCNDICCQHRSCQLHTLMMSTLHLSATLRLPSATVICAYVPPLLPLASRPGFTTTTRGPWAAAAAAAAWPAVTK